MKGFGAYKGKHWTQLPENKDRLRKMVAKSAKARLLARKQSKAEKIVVKKLKHRMVHKEQDTILHLNGWRIALTSNEIRIERDVKI